MWVFVRNVKRRVGVGLDSNVYIEYYVFIVRTFWGWRRWICGCGCGCDTKQYMYVYNSIC
jgi:hypothetical protein